MPELDTYASCSILDNKTVLIFLPSVSMPKAISLSSNLLLIKIYGAGLSE
jgi:hypothetical protein